MPPPPSLPVSIEELFSEVVSLADICDLVAKVAPVADIPCRRIWNTGNGTAAAVQALTALTAALNASDVVLPEGTAAALAAGMTSLIDVSISATAAAPAAGASAVVDPVIAAAAPLLTVVLEHVTVVGEYLVYNLPDWSTYLLSNISSNLAEFEAAEFNAAATYGGGLLLTGDAAATYEATVAQVQA